MIPKEKPPGTVLKFFRRYKVLQPYVSKGRLAGPGPLRKFFSRRPFVLFIVVSIIVGGCMGPFLGKKEMYGKNRAKMREKAAEKTSWW